MYPSRKPPHKMESLLSGGRPQKKRTVVSCSKQGCVDGLNRAKNQNWSGGRSRTARDKETTLNQPAWANFSGFHLRLPDQKERKCRTSVKIKIRNFTNTSCSSCSNQLPHTKWAAGVETKLGLALISRHELHWWLRSNGCNWNKSLTLLKES